MKLLNRGLLGAGMEHTRLSERNLRDPEFRRWIDERTALRGAMRSYSKPIWQVIRERWVREEAPLAPLTDEAGNPLTPPTKIYWEEEGWAHVDLKRLRADLGKFRKASWHVGFGTGVMLASVLSPLIIRHPILAFCCAFLYIAFVPGLLRPFTLAEVPID